MVRTALFSLFLLAAGCSGAGGIDGHYRRVNATPFEAAHGMAKGLLIEDGGQKAVLQHSWGNHVLNVRNEGGRLAVLEDGEPEYFITFQDGKAVISYADKFTTNTYEFVREEEK